MKIREIWEKNEELILSEFATKVVNTKGRKKNEQKCDTRTDFQRDRDRILHSKSFRRLKYKTQVFISPEGDHYRTRLTHTLEVSQIARTIARGLRLNEDLTEAIALGHDLGHTPFGHLGEMVLSEVSVENFEHSEQSVRVVDVLEKNGNGLNLTFETLDGIKNHRSSGSPHTLEGRIVQLSDKIAYLHHDIDDAIRAEILTESQLPKKIIKVLGNTQTKRVDSLITNIIYNSQNKSAVNLTPEYAQALNDLREFMFKNVYIGERFNSELTKVKNVLVPLFNYYKENPDKMHEDFIKMHNEGVLLDIVVKDYIAGMTDRFAVKEYTNLFVPTSWNVMH